MPSPAGVLEPGRSRLIGEGMTVCAACGTENRDKARYCRGCACALPLVQDAMAEGAAFAVNTSRRRRRRTDAKDSSSVRRRSGRAVGVVMAVVAMGLGAAWWAMTRQAPVSATPVFVVAPSDRAPPMVRLVPATRETTSTSEAPPFEVMATAATSQPAATPTRVVAREPRPAAERARTQRATVRNAAPAPTAETLVRETEPVAAPPIELAQAPAPPAPVPVQTVDQMCAGSSNFLTRDLCRARVCRNGVFSGDPVCVRFREIEEENRRRMQ